ncbi:unnamed protein product, partial [marine sediment metagenome]
GKKGAVTITRQKFRRPTRPKRPEVFEEEPLTRAGDFLREPTKLDVRLPEVDIVVGVLGKVKPRVVPVVSQKVSGGVGV